MKQTQLSWPLAIEGRRPANIAYVVWQFSNIERFFFFLILNTVAKS